MVAIRRTACAAMLTLVLACVAGVGTNDAQAPQGPHILQRPALSRDLIAFGYAGDLWTVPRAGGRATRLTTGVGIETEPGVFAGWAARLRLRASTTGIRMCSRFR